jgi:hypothetical protein
MNISSFLNKLVLGLSEKNYDQTLSDYRLWMGIGVTHGWIPNDQLYYDILASMKPESVDPPSAQVIHRTSHLLLRFVTEVGNDPVLSAYVSGTHERLCHQSLKNFFTVNMGVILGNEVSTPELRKFYTDVNFLAHWVNLGYLNVKDVKNHILQSLTFKPTLYVYQSNSLAVLLKISGAIFAANVDPSVMDRCCDALKSANLGSTWVAAGLIKVRVLISTAKAIYEC